VTSYASVEHAWREVQRGAAASLHLALVSQAAVDAADTVALEGIQLSLPVISTCALSLARSSERVCNRVAGGCPTVGLRLERATRYWQRSGRVTRHALTVGAGPVRAPAQPWPSTWACAAWRRR
jgi:hypothetical protein